MKKVLQNLALSAALSALIAPVQALEFNQVQLDKSSLSFVSKQMNVPVEGRFKRFRSVLSFDPAKPTFAKAELEIDLSSIDAGSPEANEEVTSKAWFNTKVFPVARFVATSVKPLAANRFEVLGHMTIKGKTLEVSAPVNFRQDAGNGIMDGSFVLKRADYGLGEGIWADFGTVANEIQIKFRLVATAKK